MQRTERLGPAWTDTILCFTREDGTAVRPGWVSERFGTLAARAGLAPVRFHDLRHGSASMLLAAGASIKVVSGVMGHVADRRGRESLPYWKDPRSCGGGSGI